MVFQDYALYPHMNVYENMAFSLKVRGVGAARSGMGRSRSSVDPSESDSFCNRRRGSSPAANGSAWRWGALSCAIPKVFPFDEPLSNLDAKLRVQVRTEIKKLHERVATTVIYVTHDQVEAMTLADRIVVLKTVRSRGRHPEDVYETPATVFVAAGGPTMNPGPLPDRGRDRAVRPPGRRVRSPGAPRIAAAGTTAS